MLQAIRIDMGVFLAIVVIFYGGELVWRERSLRVAPVCDALPTPSWIHLGSKVAALVLIAACFVAAGIASTVLVQVSRGYLHLEPGLYARGFVAIVTPFVLLAVLSFVVQVVVNNKFIGYLLMIVLLLARSASPMLGLAHNLYRYGGHPPLLYSDMNGFGPYAAPFVWFQVYWGFGAAILLVLALLFWVRGAETPLRTRLAEARSRWRGPARIVFATAAVGMVASGAYIYYNTNVLNEYVSRGERKSRLASYERQYRGYRDTPLPQITAVRTEVAMFPGERPSRSPRQLPTGEPRRGADPGTPAHDRQSVGPGRLSPVRGPRHRPGEPGSPEPPGERSRLRARLLRLRARRTTRAGWGHGTVSALSHAAEKKKEVSDTARPG